MGVAYVKILQDNDPKYFKVISTPKHFTVYSGTEPDRLMFNAVMSCRGLCGTYFPAFEACVKEVGYRTNLKIPAVQEKLIKAVKSKRHSGRTGFNKGKRSSCRLGG